MVSHGGYPSVEWSARTVSVTHCFFVGLVCGGRHQMLVTECDQFSSSVAELADGFYFFLFIVVSLASYIIGVNVVEY